jgi:hypothetical protein
LFIALLFPNAPLIGTSVLKTSIDVVEAVEILRVEGIEEIPIETGLCNMAASANVDWGV